MSGCCPDCGNTICLCNSEEVTALDKYHADIFYKLEQENQKLKSQVKIYADNPDYALIVAEENMKLKELVKEAIEYLPRSNVEINCDCKCPTCMWLEKARQVVGEE